MTLGEKIMRLRQSKGLSQEEFGEKWGFPSGCFKMGNRADNA